MSNTILALLLLHTIRERLPTNATMRKVVRTLLLAICCRAVHLQDWTLISPTSITDIDRRSQTTAELIQGQRSPTMSE